MLKLSFHFHKVNQTKLFKNWILAFKKKQKKSYSHGHLVRSTVLLKAFKIYVFRRYLFWKTKNVKTLNFLLVKNIGKNFSRQKILTINDHPSFNILFYWCLNRPPQLNADECKNVPTLPIKYQVIKNGTLLKVWSFCVHYP